MKLKVFLRKSFIFLLSLFGIFLLWILIQAIGVKDVIRAVSALSWWQVMVIAIFPLLTYFLGALRWRLILRASATKINLIKLWQWTFYGAAVSLVAPSFDISGQTTKGFLLRRAAGHDAVAFGSVFLDSLVRAVNNFSWTFIFLALALIFGSASSQNLLLFWILAAMLVLIAFTWDLLRRGGAVSQLLIRLFRRREETHVEIRELDRFFQKFLQRKKLVIGTLTISFAGLFWEVTQIMIVLKFLGVAGGVLPAIGIFLGEAIPGSVPVPGGIGFKETGAALAGAYFGLGGGVGLATMLFLRLRDLATLLVAALIFLKNKTGL